MLIHQTDSYLFRDEIEEWCNKGYDYIGGPIISTLKEWSQDDINNWEPKVGNGGLSLRRICIFKDITNPNGALMKYLNLDQEILDNIYNEDSFFCNFISKVYIMNMPDWYEAAKFLIKRGNDVLINDGKEEEKQDKEKIKELKDLGVLPEKIYL